MLEVATMGDSIKKLKSIAAFVDYTVNSILI